MDLILRRTSYHAKLTGKDWLDFGDDDYLVLHDGVIVGRIHHHERLRDVPSWKWALQIHPAPPPNIGYEPTLEECKAAFKQRYEQVKQTSG
jgi:hypothetical protein